MTAATPGGLAGGTSPNSETLDETDNWPGNATSITADTDCLEHPPSPDQHQPPSPVGSDHLLPVRVKLISSVRVPPHQSAVVQVQAPIAMGTAILEPAQKKTYSLGIRESLIDFLEEGTAWLALANPGHHTRVLRKGTTIGTVCGVEVVSVESLLNGETTHQLPLPGPLRTRFEQSQEPKGEQATGDVEARVTSHNDDLTPTRSQPDQQLCQDGRNPCNTMTGSEPSLPMTEKQEPRPDEGCLQSSPIELVRRVVDDQPWSAEKTAWRKQKLQESLDLGDSLDPEQLRKSMKVLQEHHDAFALEEDERGETDLVEFTVDTGGAQPLRQPPRRIPFAARQAVSKQLEMMLRTGVIQPSRSPWASPVVSVRKKDGSLRFCIDYRPLNAVTKPDLFPLPRIDDLLDQLGKSKFFSTLDLASGHWQIKVQQESREKTAFIINDGLYEFRVLPFGLRNAPAMFQRLMQQVLSGLNFLERPDFVTVYLDDVLIFSETFNDHLSHLRQVIGRIMEAGLKLKPAKFVKQEVSYLGHVITPREILPNPNWSRQ